MSFGGRLKEIRDGFERPFWVANISELFERLSYYAAFASLARYLHETLSFPAAQASSLTGLFGGLVWFLAAFGGTLGGSPGLPPIAFARVFHFKRLVLSAGLAGLVVARAGACSGAAVVAGRFCTDAAGAWHCAGQTLRGGNNGARVKRKCPLHRLFHLLHAREYRWSGGAVHGFLGAPAHARGKRIPGGGAERFPDVPGGIAFFQRATAIKRSANTQRGRSAAKFCDSVEQSAIHDFSFDFFWLLDCVLAGIHSFADLRARLRESQYEHRENADYRSTHGNCVSAVGQFFDEKGCRLSGPSRWGH